MKPELLAEGRNFEQRRAAARGARGLREHQHVGRLALLAHVGASEFERALRLRVDPERKHRLLARMRAACLRPQVGLGETLAHFVRVGAAPLGVASHAGNRQAQQNRVAARLVLEPAQGFGVAALVQEVVDEGEPGVKVSVYTQRMAKRRFGCRVAPGAHFEFGERRQQPGANRGGETGGGEQLVEAAARGVEFAAQPGVLSRAGARVQRCARGLQTGARLLRRVQLALHAPHRGEDEPGLHGARVALHEALEVLRRGVEIVQVLLQRREHEQHVVGRVRGVGPGLQNRQRLAGEARVAEFARTVQVALRQRHRELRVVRLRTPGLACASIVLARASRAGQDFDDLVVVRRRDHAGACAACHERHAQGECHQQGGTGERGDCGASAKRSGVRGAEPG